MCGYTGTVTPKMCIRDRVYIDAPGTYQVQYDVTTADGFKAETKYREIVVKKENLLENAVLTAANSKEGYEPMQLNDEDERCV